MSKYWNYNGPEGPTIWSLTEAGKEKFGTRSRSITTRNINAIRDNLIEVAKVKSTKIAQALASGKNPAKHLNDFKALLKQLHVAQYQLAKGGPENMTSRDYGRIGAKLARQYREIDRWLRKIERTDTFPSPQQAKNIMRVFLQTTRQSYERGKAAAFGLPLNPRWKNRELPQFPGDGETVCKSGCGCTWVITREETRWTAWWKIDRAKENCVDCLELADAKYSESNPLIIAYQEDPLIGMEIEEGEE